MKARIHTTPTGIEITYRVVNDHGATGTPLIFTGGLGGTHLMWTALTKALRGRHRIIIWDYPGLTTGLSKIDIPLDVPSLARYLFAVLEKESIESACLVGWSIGPQVIFEFAHQFKGIANSIVALSGGAQSPFANNPTPEPISAALGLPSTVPEAMSWISNRIDKVDRLKSMLQRIEHPTRWAKRFGFVDPVVDELIFDAVIRNFIALNPRVYRQYIESASKHKGFATLKNLDIPVLLASGEMDKVVPIAKMRAMSRKIPNAQFLKVKGATHFLPLEYPALIGLEIDDFLKKHRIQ